MKQYKFISQHLGAAEDSVYTEAYIDPADLSELKKLAGIVPITEYYTAGGHDPELTVPNDSNTGRLSPVGSNISYTANEKRRLERQNNIKPGTDEWFKLWFSRPYLTGEKPVGDAPARRIAKKRK